MTYFLIYILVGLFVVITDTIIDIAFANQIKRMMYRRNKPTIVSGILIGAIFWPVYLYWSVWDRIQRRKHFGTKVKDNDQN